MICLIIAWCVIGIYKFYNDYVDCKMYGYEFVGMFYMLFGPLCFVPSINSWLKWK